MSPLDASLRRASPRYNKVATPAIAVAIHLGIAMLWLALIVRPFAGQAFLPWSVGIVYVAYDTALLAFTFLATFSLGRAAPRQPVGAHLRVAVLIAAHNEAAVLEATLRALASQTDPPDEILIADDGSTDQTATVLVRHGLVQPRWGERAHAGKISWLRLARGGKARALNSALAQTGCDVVLTVDADTLLEPAAVGEMRRAFMSCPTLVAATGILTPVSDRTLRGRTLQWFQKHEYLRNFLSRAAWMRVDGLLLISGAFAGFRRDALVRVGGFDPDCLVEDYELIHRLRRYGAIHGLSWTTAVLGRAHATTDAPSTVGAFLRQRRRWFGGFLQTQFWYREMVGNRRYGHLGTWMLPVKAADTLQPVFGLSAAGLLLYHLIAGHSNLVRFAADIIGAKLFLDLGFYLWAVRRYRIWVGGSGRISYGSALLAALVEPFSFQILRHVGALLGWISVITGQVRWGRQMPRADLLRQGAD